MNPKDVLLMNLKRQDLDYQVKAREALIYVDDALRKKDIAFVKQLLNEFVFLEKSKLGRLTSTQELQLVVIMLTDFFAVDDASKKPFLFFSIFEPNKTSRKFLLLKFVMTAIAVGSAPALNISGTYMLDPSTEDFRKSGEFGSLLIQEIIFYANNSVEKLKSLPALSPIFTNALCLMFAENFVNDQMPPPLIGNLLREFLEVSPPSFIFTFTIPSQVRAGSIILAAFFRWSVLSEIYEEKPSFSHFHLKVLECIAAIDPTMPSKPIIYTENLENIADLICRVRLTHDPEKVQKSLLKFGQIIQVSKKFLYGNITSFVDKLKTMPKNSFVDLIISNL